MRDINKIFLILFFLPLCVFTAADSHAKNTKDLLADTKKNLITIAKEITQQERDLTALEKRIAQHERDKKHLETTQAHEQKNISALITAMTHLRQMPVSAVITRPAAPIQNAQSAMLLQSTLPHIQAQTATLTQNIKKLDNLILRLKQDKKMQRTAMTQLKSQHKKISTLLTQRQTMFKQNNQNWQQNQKQRAAIATQAKNLNDLVTRLEKQRHMRTEQYKMDQATQNEQKKIKKNLFASFHLGTPKTIPKTGEKQLPIAGDIQIAYGQPDDIGATSQGLHMIGRNNALVVAPMGGVVRYTGVFRNYGNIVIVEHEKDMHSLIAGLAKIDTVEGQNLSAGEPIGTLPTVETGTPTLYYELRRKGKPVNPKTVFKDLKI